VHLKLTPNHSPGLKTAARFQETHPVWFEKEKRHLYESLQLTKMNTWLDEPFPTDTSDILQTE